MAKPHKTAISGKTLKNRFWSHFSTPPKKCRKKSRTCRKWTNRAKFGTFGPEKRLAIFDRKKSDLDYDFYGPKSFPLFGVRRIWPPDFPWAFRRQTPGLVVYRGTPIWGGSRGGPEMAPNPVFRENGLWSQNDAWGLKIGSGPLFSSKSDPSALPK